MRNKRKEMIADALYMEKTSPIHHKQTVTNMELYDIFKRLRGNTYIVEKLKIALQGKIRVNTDDPRSSVISSSYLKRLNKITGLKWHQRREKGEKGEKLVKFYTDPEYANAGVADGWEIYDEE